MSQEEPLLVSGEDECNITGDPTSPTVLSSLTDGLIRHIKSTLPVLRSTGSFDTRMQGGTEVVGHPHDKLEWEVSPQEGGGFDNRLRCLPDWVGCNLPEPEDRRSMVPGGRQNAHKLFRAAGSNSSSQDISERQKQDACTTQIRQHHCSGIYKQPGRNSLQESGRPGKEFVDVVPGEEYSYHSPASARSSECDSRYGISKDDGSVGLAIEPTYIQKDCQQVWSYRGGHVCLTPHNPVPSLLQLATRSLCSSNRCLSAGLVSNPGLCQSTLVSDRTGSVQGTDGTVPNYLGGTNLEDTAMVCTVTSDVDSITMSDQPQSDYFEQRSGGSHPSTSRVAYLRERYRDHELSEEATSLMLKSWRTKTSTCKSYDSLFGIWYSWCRTRDSDPFSGPIREVVNFLADLHKQGYQYRSLNSYCSAISSVHERVDGHTVGQHPLVTRLMKGVFNDRPPLPRYICTWNVQTVLSHILSWGTMTPCH